MRFGRTEGDRKGGGRRTEGGGRRAEGGGKRRKVARKLAEGGGKWRKKCPSIVRSLVVSAWETDISVEISRGGPVKVCQTLVLRDQMSSCVCRGAAQRPFPCRSVGTRKELWVVGGSLVNRRDRRQHVGRLRGVRPLFHSGSRSVGAQSARSFTLYDLEKREFSCIDLKKSSAFWTARTELEGL